MPAGPELRTRVATVLRRAGRRTNLGLLLLLIGSFLTGWSAFATAQGHTARSVAVAHGTLGLGLVAVAPWKVVLVSRARRLRAASIALTLVVGVCLVAGVVEVLVGPDVTGGLTPIQVHVSSAVLLVVLAVWHVVRYRRRRLVRQTDVSRRRLLRTTAFVAAAAGAYVVVDGVGAVTGSSHDRAPTGSHPIAPAEIPATIWLLDRVPELSWTTHRLSVGGLLLSPADLDPRGREVRARLDCTTGWYADAIWTGVPLSELLSSTSLAGAESVVVTSTTGYHRRFGLDTLPRLYLATRVEGRRLTPGTGAPVRLVAPGHRGFWWVKWVASVETSPYAAGWQSPFPLQ